MTLLRSSLVAGIVLAVASAGCAGEAKVVRVYDGRIVEGRYVPPEAYASFLRGALAEESGDLAGAASAYARAADEDDDDPAVWSRLGEVRCRKDLKDASADDAFERALRADPTYAGALEARARCALARGRPAEAAELAARGASYDPGNVELAALLVRADARRGDARGRERAVALTLAHGDRAAAWDALMEWGRGHRDAELVARGLQGLVRTAPARSAEVERGALLLAGEGHPALARAVAAAVADAPRRLEVRGPRDATVARLAVDEALARGDREAAVARATRGHVPLSEVAARAVAFERPEIAAAVARAVADADPGASAAHMVLAAASGATRARAEGLARPTDAPSPVAVLVFADRLTGAAGAEVARQWLARVAPCASAPHDPVVTALAVELGARGVLDEGALTAEQRIELAARRREPPPPLAEGEAAVDPKHALLHLALTDPNGGRARTLAARLADAAERDPIVGFALARIALASPAPVGDAPTVIERVRRAVAAAPLHPLMLAAAVELAKKSGRADELAPARTRLMAVAQTPAERALATE